MEFEKSGISYILEKDEYESDDLFYKRAWYIANKMPETDIDLEKQILAYMDFEPIIDKISVMDLRIFSPTSMTIAK